MLVMQQILALIQQAIGSTSTVMRYSQQIQIHTVMQHAADQQFGCDWQCGQAVWVSTDRVSEANATVPSTCSQRSCSQGMPAFSMQPVASLKAKDCAKYMEA